jgi:hypothetical protein
MHISHDNHGGITSIAEQPPLDGLLTQVNLINVDHELEKPLTRSVTADVGLLDSRRPWRPLSRS